MSDPVDTMAPAAISGSGAMPLPVKTVETNGNGVQKKKTPLEMISQGVSLPGIPKFPSYVEQRQWTLEKMALAFRVFARKGRD